MRNLLLYSIKFSAILVANKNARKVNSVTIVLPGMNVPPEEYVELSGAIQAEGNSKNIYSDFFIANVSSTSKYAYEDAVCDIRKYIAEEYGSATPRFLVGHSIGALFGVEIARDCCELLVQLGQTFASQIKVGISKGKTLKEYEKPALTILGEKDAFFNYTEASEDLRSTLFSTTKMLVVVPELTHMQMAGGELSESAKELGMVEPVSGMKLRTAHGIISNLVVEFLDSTYYDRGVDAMINLHRARVRTWDFY